MDTIYLKRGVGRGKKKKKESSSNLIQLLYIFNLKTEVEKVKTDWLGGNNKPVGLLIIWSYSHGNMVRNKVSHLEDLNTFLITIKEKSKKKSIHTDLQ